MHVKRLVVMFAVIKTGGKQYKVQAGDVLRVEKIDKAEGENIFLDDVLMAFNGREVLVGTPILSGVKGQATVLSQMRDKKVIVFKKKRRHNYRRKKGHRQFLTVLKIENLMFT